MSTDEVLLFFLMMVSGWLPPCHKGAADCRPDRFLLSGSSCTSSLAHMHASSLLQPVSVSTLKMVSRVIFISHGRVSLVASWLIEHGGACVDWTQLVNLHWNGVKKTHRGRRSSAG